MLFPTLNFGLFFLVVFTISWLLYRRPGARIVFLIVASYVFYAFWDWRFCGLLFASSTANWGFGRWIYRLRRPASKQWIVALAITANLLTLGFFKYCNFFIGSANGVLEWVGGARDIPYLRVVLPVGISFFTFHGISYVVDIYRGKLARPASYRQMLLYISFFPQLVAGPIIRASHFLPQLALRVDPDDIRATRAFLLILGGLFKKVVVANYLSTDLVDDVFFDPGRYGAADLLLASYGLRRPDLLRFQRLHGYCDRRRGAVRLPLSAEFRPALPVAWDAGFLAALAYLAVVVASGLSLHLARREYRRLAALPQPDDHDAAGRALARRRLEFRDLGRVARGDACGRAFSVAEPQGNGPLAPLEAGHSASS